MLCAPCGRYVAAIIANSLALQADCVSMAVDALSYLGNMFAECQTSAIKRARLELTMSAISLALLAYFTGFFFLEAAHSAGLLHDEAATEEEEVDPYIVLAFAALGILFDVLSLLSYKVWHADAGTAERGASGDINMLTALLHVLSDLLRSTTTFVEGLVLLQSLKHNSWNWNRFSSAPVSAPHPAT